MKRNGTTAEQKAENYRWRSEALDKKIGLEELAIVLQRLTVRYMAQAATSEQ